MVTDLTWLLIARGPLAPWLLVHSHIKKLANIPLQLLIFFWSPCTLCSLWCLCDICMNCFVFPVEIAYQLKSRQVSHFMAKFLLQQQQQHRKSNISMKWLKCLYWSFSLKNVIGDFRIFLQIQLYRILSWNC